MLLTLPLPKREHARTPSARNTRRQHRDTNKRTQQGAWTRGSSSLDAHTHTTDIAGSTEISIRSKLTLKCAREKKHGGNDNIFWGRMNETKTFSLELSRQLCAPKKQREMERFFKHCWAFANDTIVVVCLLFFGLEKLRQKRRNALRLDAPHRKHTHITAALQKGDK